MLKHSCALVVTYVVMCLALGSECVQAQAYCGLRDPVRNLYKIYPEADGYRSIVRSVDKETRLLVSGHLPFTLHFNELAKHTVYVPVKARQPVGLVHVRSEKGKWGLVEIAWAFDLDLNIKGFHFRRCRDKHKSALQAPTFMSQFIGKGVPALRLMLSEDGKSLDSTRISVPKGGESLALTIVRSALKTITVTDIVWAEDIRFLRAMAEATSIFPNTHKLVEVHEIYTPSVTEALEAIEQASESIIQRKTVEVYLALDEADHLQGTLFKMTCVLGEERLDLWSAVMPDHKIYRMDPIPDWPGDEFKEAFDRLIGMTEKDIHQCSTATDMVGAEVIVVSRVHTGM